MERKEGYYWVRMSDTKDGWEVAEFRRGSWSIFNGVMTVYEDCCFLEINENRIPAPDENNGIILNQITQSLKFGIRVDYDPKTNLISTYRGEQVIAKNSVMAVNFEPNA